MQSSLLSIHAAAFLRTALTSSAVLPKMFLAENTGEHGARTCDKTAGLSKRVLRKRIALNSKYSCSGGGRSSSSSKNSSRNSTEAARARVGVGLGVLIVMYTLTVIVIVMVMVII